VRLCPRTAAGGDTTFEQYTPLALPMSKACVAPTGRARCAGPSCVGGCEDEQSAEKCTACCGGKVLPALAPCVFPFDFPLGQSHDTCITYVDADGATKLGADGAAVHWCPTAVDANRKPLAGRALP
jgi:hypothetical protein